MIGFRWLLCVQNGLRVIRKPCTKQRCWYCACLYLAFISFAQLRHVLYICIVLYNTVELHLHGTWLSGSPIIRITNYPDRRLSGSPIIRITNYPDHRLSGSPIIRIADYPDHLLSGSPIIRIADCPDRLGHSGKFVEDSTNPTCLEITGYQIKCGTVL